METTKIKTKYLIAIDPDLHKSGYCEYDIENKIFIVCRCVPIWELFDILFFKQGDIFVLLEYPDNTNTWHKGGKGASLNVGKNQAIAIVIKEFLDSIHKNKRCFPQQIKYKLLKPAGYSQIFKNKSIFENTTGWKEQTNEDSRAAAAMVWCNKDMKF